MFTSFSVHAIGLAADARETIELAALAGFGGVDLLVRDIVDAGNDPKGLRARMDDLGIRGGAWPLPMDWRGDEDRFQADLRRLPALARVAETLGLSRTATWLMTETPQHPPTDAAREAHRREVHDLHAHRLGAIARVLDDQGTRLGLEVIGVEASRTGSGMPIYSRLSDPAVLDLLERLRSEVPSVGLLIDAFHLYAAGEPMEVGWAQGIESVVWVHVADLPASACADRHQMRDQDRGLPGENGAIDVGRLLAGLRERGYEGPVTAEPLGGCKSLAGLDGRAMAEGVATALARAWPVVSTDIRPSS